MAHAFLGAVLSSTACMVSPEGEFESHSTGTGGTTGTGTGFPPDVVECDFELGANPLGMSACDDDEDCCDGPLVALGFACPSDEFPNNWTCENNVCRQRSAPSADEGCSVDNDDDDMDEDCLFPGFTCVVVSGVGHCLAECTATADCASQHNMRDSTCETVGSGTYCIQPQP